MDVRVSSGYVADLGGVYTFALRLLRLVASTALFLLEMAELVHCKSDHGIGVHIEQAQVLSCATLVSILSLRSLKVLS